MEGLRMEAIFVEQRFGLNPPGGQGVDGLTPQEGRLCAENAKSKNTCPYGAPWAPWAGADGPRPMGQGRWASRTPPWGYIPGPEADGAPWGIFKGPRPIGPHALHGPRG